MCTLAGGIFLGGTGLFIGIAALCLGVIFYKLVTE